MIVEWRAWDSLSELEEFLRKHSYRMLHRSSEPESEFYSVAVSPELGESSVRQVTFGICCEGHGIKPQLLTLQKGSGYLLSVDDIIIGVDARTGEDLFRISFECSLVHSMSSIGDQSKILIFHEIGVALINDAGKTLWNFSRDVVTISSVVRDVIHLSFMDEPPTRLSIDTGLELDSQGS